MGMCFKLSKSLTIFAAMLACLGFLAGCTNFVETNTSEATLYLVRHAEKEPGRDPVLTPDGEQRAEDLVTALADADIEIIYSTDYKRTRATAAPIARARNLPIIFYDPGDLEAFAAQLKSGKRSALIVGHSNTTPQLVTTLGGEAGAPITEATEYDRLYQLSLGEDIETVILRYGTATAR